MKTYESLFSTIIVPEIKSVPEINVPIMKPSRKKPFKKEWINNATTKISNQIKQKSMQIAEWILNAKLK